MKNIIEPMISDDWPEVKAIYEEALLSGQSTFETTCPSYEEWSAHHLLPCRLVLRVQGQIAGWCALSHFSSRSAYRGVAEVSLYIKSTEQGKGWGTALLNRLCQESEKAGFWSLYSCIFSTNVVSIHVHEICGFRRIGYREKIAKDRFGQWQDTILLEKRSLLY